MYNIQIIENSFNVNPTPFFSAAVKKNKIKKVDGEICNVSSLLNK